LAPRLNFHPEPTALDERLPAGAQRAIRRLVGDYSMECKCHKGVPCECANTAASDIRKALENAVERQFAPPNMYYRTKDGYSFRLRGFQKPQDPPHVERPAPEPVHVFRRATQPRKPDARPPPKTAPKVNGLPPLPVNHKFVHQVSPSVFKHAHASWDVASHEAPPAPESKKTARTTSLYQLPMLAGDSEEEEDADDELYSSKWFDDWMDYSKLILSDGPLAEAEEASALQQPPTMAVEMPYQLGQEADWADWENAYAEDAVRPFRVAEGRESFYPDVDANAAFPEAVLQDYGGESADAEAYANFVSQQQASPAPPSSSVAGWLTDNPAY